MPQAWEQLRYRPWLCAAIATVAFVVTSQLAELWTIASRGWQPFQPATGVALAITMVLTRASFLRVTAAAVTLGSLGHSLIEGHSGADTVAFAGAFLVQGVGSGLIARLLGRRLAQADVLLTVAWLAGAIALSMAGALIAAPAAADERLADHLLLWTLAHGVGTYLVAPAPFVRGARKVPTLHRFWAFELQLVSLLLGLITIVSFATATPVAYLVLPGLAWLSLRGGSRFGYLAAVGVAVYACAATAAGSGPFADDPFWPFTPLHAFLLAVSVSVGSMNMFVERAELRRAQINAILTAIPDTVVLVDEADDVVASNRADGDSTAPFEIAGRRPQVAEVSIDQDDHTERVVESRRVDLQDGTALSVVRDITDLVSMSEDLSASAERWRRILLSAQEGIAETEGRVISYASDLFASMVGRPAEELIGVRVGSLFTPATYPDASAAAAQVERGEQALFEAELERPDGTALPVVVSVTPETTPFDETTRSSVFVTDISAIKAAERDRIELADRLETVEVTEQTRLARDLHDGPLQDLTAVQLILSHLASQPGPDAELVNKAADAMVDALIALRSGVHALEPVDVSSGSLGEALERHAFRARGASEIDVQVEVTGDPPRGATAQVLYRIGREAITNATRHANPSTIRISVASEGDEFVLRVSDDGKGFERELTPLTGHIGLRSIQERAKRADGELHIESAVGTGTSVEVRLPVRTGPSAPVHR